MKKIILITVLLLLVLTPVAFWWFCQRPVPQLDGREQIAGLGKAVVVRFDAQAVPYIEAHSETDAYVAQGYVTARERMFQMDVLRRSASGHMSEVFGSVALPTDRLVRTLGLKRLAVEEFHRLSPQGRQAVDAFTRGVNAYLSENPGRLGLEFTLLGYSPGPWHPEDCLAILKYVAYKADESWRLDDFRQRLANKLGDSTVATLFRDDLATYGLPKIEAPPAKKMPAKAVSDALLRQLAQLGDEAHQFDSPKPNWGSNALVVPNTKTRTRGALLACDKHGPLTTPSEWFICSINAPGLHIAGATIPGVPGVWVGRNQDISWGSAALKADVQDIFLEQFESQFASNYRVGDKWQEAEVLTEIIPVRLAKDVEHKVLITRHGPVLFRINDAGISLSWTGTETDRPVFDALYKLNHASGWQDFSAALSTYSDPPQLFVFADRWGNSGCQAAGIVPIRTKATQGTMLTLGSEPKSKWDGFIPFDKLPQSFVPAGTESGAMPVIAANQRPSTGTALPKAPASLILGHQWNAPYRANRWLNSLANAKAPIGLADINVLQGDEYLPVPAVLTKALQQAAVATNYIDRNGVRAIESLLKWDGQMRAGSAQGSIYESFVQTFARRLLEPTLGRDMTTEYLERWPMWVPLVESVIRNQPAAWMPPEERTYETFFLTTLAQSMKSLKIASSENEPMNWLWGKFHTATFRHVSPNATPIFRYFALGPVPVGGTANTLNSCDVKIDPRALHYFTESGPTQRMIVDMSDRDKFYQALSTGQSGHRFSPHRDDQLEAWKRVDLAPIAFSSDQLVRQAKHRLVLESIYGP